MDEEGVEVLRTSQEISIYFFNNLGWMKYSNSLILIPKAAYDSLESIFSKSINFILLKNKKNFTWQSN